MIVDLFAGPRGWSEGLRLLGLTDIGLEWDTAACRTAHAAGHPVIQTDVAMYPTAPFANRITGLIASPPCQAWSRAGKRGGLHDQPLVHQAVSDLAAGRDTRTDLLTRCRDARSLLAAEPMRWLADLRPEWVCMEEVPDVLPLWRQYAEHLRAWGYSVWTGELNAADYGVPQTRKRAILIASRSRRVTAPTPTHSRHDHGDGLFGESLAPWVSMAKALGWTTGLTVNTRGERKSPSGNEFPADQPSWALTEKTRSWVLRSNAQAKATVRAIHEPAATLFFGHRRKEVAWSDGQDERPITQGEAAILQSFSPDYPWQGSKTKQFEQIGNAVPPLLAAHIVSAATGIPVRQDLPAAA